MSNIFIDSIAGSAAAVKYFEINILRFIFAQVFVLVLLFLPTTQTSETEVMISSFRSLSHIAWATFFLRDDFIFPSPQRTVRSSHHKGQLELHHKGQFKFLFFLELHHKGQLEVVHFLHFFISLLRCHCFHLSTASSACRRCT